MNKIKLTILAVAAAAICSTAMAHDMPILIDRTPGGWEVGVDPFPQVFWDVIHADVRGGFFDSISATPWTEPNGTQHPPGWVNLYGILHGQDYIQTDLLDHPGTGSAQLAWNFSGSIHYLVYVLVEGSDSQGAWDNIYQVRYTGGNRNGSSDGFIPITLHDDASIQSIAFYGNYGLHVPEGGATAALLLVGLGALALFRLGKAVLQLVANPSSLTKGREMPKLGSNPVRVATYFL